MIRWAAAFVRAGASFDKLRTRRGGGLAVAQNLKTCLSTAERSTMSPSKSAKFLPPSAPRWRSGRPGRPKAKPSRHEVGGDLTVCCNSRAALRRAPSTTLRVVPLPRFADATRGRRGAVALPPLRVSAAHTWKASATPLRRSATTGIAGRARAPLRALQPSEKGRRAYGRAIAGSAPVRSDFNSAPPAISSITSPIVRSLLPNSASDRPRRSTMNRSPEA